MQADFAFQLGGPGIPQGSLRQDGQTFQESAIDKRHHILHVFEAGITGDRFQLAAEFGDDFFEALRLEYLGGGGVKGSGVFKA
jgi:hypothetical protein